MPVNASKFILATPTTAGVVQGHITGIHSACKAANTFLFVRPSTVPTMRLIDAGFATKSMDVHDKSSDWGLTSGLVPCDQAFSKALKGTPESHPHYHAHGKAQVIHLNLGKGVFEKLSGQNHFEHMAEIQAGPGVSEHGTEKYRHFHCAGKNAHVNFAIEKITGKVFWYWRAALGNHDPKTLVPIYVWGYDGVAVTGDYDMWMVAPHISSVAGKTTIHSIKDSHGRSAASGFTSDFITKLNQACNRVKSPVFNHGAEAQNVSFTQAMDRYLALFCPGKMSPVMIPRVVLPGVLHDLLLHGYLVIRNPKWISGSTLGIEDMAAAEEQFPNDGAVKAGVGAMNQLKSNAATAIQAAFRNRKDKLGGGSGNVAKASAGWQERYNQLRYFRAVGNTADVNEIRDRLLLPGTAFPSWGSGSDADIRSDVQRIAREAEKSFGRTGFVKDGDSVSPVDQTKGGPSVNQLKGFWESQKGKS